MSSKGYRHLTYEDRCQIYTLNKSGMSNSDISIELKVDRSTIGRELKRNAGDNGYRFKQAHNLSILRRINAGTGAKKLKGDTLNFVEDKLINHQWSPEQISGFMKKNLDTRVSHELIYQHVWRDKHNGGKLYKNLRHGSKKYNKRSGKNAGRGVIPGRVDIDERPKIVESKNRLGDWELDTIIGKNHNGAIVSMVDRASKFTKLSLVEDKTAESVTMAIKEALGNLEVLTMTADNGKEFAYHIELKEFLGAQVYFAKPYHSWERGLNEHTNGLVRQYFPKNTKFDSLNPDDVGRVEFLLNTRPRKSLDFRTPMEVFFEATELIESVALQS